MFMIMTNILKNVYGFIVTVVLNIAIIFGLEKLL